MPVFEKDTRRLWMPDFEKMIRRFWMPVFEIKLVGSGCLSLKKDTLGTVFQVAGSNRLTVLSSD